MDKPKKYFCNCNQIYAYPSDEMDAWIKQEFADLRNKLACADGVNRELMDRLKKRVNSQVTVR